MIIKRLIRKVKNSVCDAVSLPLRVKVRNTKTPLDIKTYDGGNQCLHPSCLYFENGWNGFKFWLVVTPYKNMDESIENPCIYTSNDGEHFKSCQTANPLDNIELSSEYEYNSDPELVYNSDLDRIECWWRRVQTSKYPNKEERNVETLYRSFTADGTLWSTKEKMYVYHNPIDATRGAISPSIIYEDGVYNIWVSSIRTTDSKFRNIILIQCTNGGQAKEIDTYTLKHSLSHITVLKEEGITIIVGFDVNHKGFPYVLYTIDNNFNIKYEGVLLKKGQRSSWDSSRLYRPYILKVDNQYWLYYSAYQEKPYSSCHIGLLKFSDWNDLLRCFIQ